MVGAKQTPLINNIHDSVYGHASQMLEKLGVLLVQLIIFIELRVGCEINL